MAKDKNKEPEQAPETQEQKADPPQPEEPEQAETSQEETELQKLQKEFEEHKQKHLRVLAEYDNFRKRTAAEKTAIYNNAVSDTVKELLPVADNIERALSQENASAEDMKKGVEMIEHQIQACFEKLGLTEMGQVGENFDPNFHNAVAHIEDENLGENVIAAVYQKGYKLGDRVVRHAMVQVAN
ncbi:MAG TPA: nucleotide exchange factor GrpE [Candidatus Acutalibacter pullicola]|uniref:Protein GrpE n=1 Tax=Candidatus Acutalibacter pullicola TaxID=2838417 RepID=A0A9D2MX23_9FIRM|nr:nucleotide exchange factor GrpE [Candidatus Acutalibacter pullicola]